MIRNVWFDIDDTLVDFRRNSLTALHSTYRRFALDRFFASSMQWIDCYHKHNAAVWRDYEAGVIDEQTLRTRRFILPLVEAGVAPDAATRIAPEMDEAYLDTLAREPHAIEGASYTLQMLKELGYTIGVISNGFDGIQQLKLDTCRLSEFIDHIVISEAVGVAKPARGIFEAAMHLAQSDNPSENLMVGDNRATDIAGALAAGWHAVLLSEHNHNDLPEKVDRISKLTDLLPVLSSISLF